MKAIALKKSNNSQKKTVQPHIITKKNDCNKVRKSKGNCYESGVV